MFKYSVLVNTLALIIVRVEAVGLILGVPSSYPLTLLAELIHHVFFCMLFGA